MTTNQSPEGLADELAIQIAGVEFAVNKRAAYERIGRTVASNASEVLTALRDHTGAGDALLREALKRAALDLHEAAGWFGCIKALNANTCSDLTREAAVRADKALSRTPDPLSELQRLGQECDREPFDRKAVLEEAARVAEDQYRDHPATTARAVNYRHAGRHIASAIRALSTKDGEQIAESANCSGDERAISDEEISVRLTAQIGIWQAMERLGYRPTAEAVKEIRRVAFAARSPSQPAADFCAENAQKTGGVE